MKRIVALVLALAMLFSFASCSIGNTEDKKFAGKVFAARVKNIEKTAEVKELVNTLNLQLRTAFCDVSVNEKTVVLKFNESISNPEEFEGKVKKYTTVLLALIRDAEKVEWSYETSGKKMSGGIDVTEATKIAGADVKSLFSSKEGVKELLISLEIANKNGSEVKVGNTEQEISSKAAA